MPKPERHLFLCLNQRPPGHPKGSCGTTGASPEVLAKFQEAFEKHQLWGKVFLSKTHCLGPCQFGAVAVVYPEGTWYGRVGVDDVEEIVEKHLVGGEPVARLQLPEELWG